MATDAVRAQRPEHARAIRPHHQQRKRWATRWARYLLP